MQKNWQLTISMRTSFTGDSTDGSVNEYKNNPGGKSMNKYVQEDQQKCLFKVNRKAFIDPQILDLEREEIFSKCWLYIGHESEVPNVGDS